MCVCEIPKMLNKLLLHSCRSSDLICEDIESGKEAGETAICLCGILRGSPSRGSNKGGEAAFSYAIGQCVAQALTTRLGAEADDDNVVVCVCVRKAMGTQTFAGTSPRGVEEVRGEGRRRRGDREGRGGSGRGRRGKRRRRSTRKAKVKDLGPPGLDLCFILCNGTRRGGVRMSPG
jgi:hypothetical protein